jgi:adenine phosphoribosyltransferase
LGVGFCPIRKAGKLPGNTIAESYGLEYGSDTLEIQVDAVASGDRVLLVDDVLATGGTLAAATQLVRTAGAVVAGATVLIELDFLSGREQLSALHVAAVIHY